MKRLPLLLALLLLGAGASAASGKIHQKGNFGIAGWLVYWDPASMEVYEKHADMIDRVYPEWYIVGADSLPRSNEFNVEKPEETAVFLAKKKKTVEIAHKNGIQIFSMIVNYDKDKGEHSTSRVEAILNDPAMRAKHIKALVDNAVRDQADGIDIDYENLKAVDAPKFSAFIDQLKAACKPHGLLVAAALAPKTDADGTWDGNQAHDYKALGRSLDLIRPMTYDEHWGTSTAGPVSSPEFSEMVDRYAASVAAPSTVELGFAGYGYDWVGKKGTTLTWSDLLALQKKGVKISRDEETQELTGRYQDAQGAAHEFWFCDAYSYRPKYAIIKKYKLAGLAMWRFGSEDPRFWEDVKAYKYAKDW
jgi:spore germination protein YaaH